MAGFCRIWFPNYRLIVKSLSEALKRQDLESLTWTKECQAAFDTIQDKLILAPALGLSDLLINLYVYERQSISLGTLTHTWATFHDR